MLSSLYFFKRHTVSDDNLVNLSRFSIIPRSSHRSFNLSIEFWFQFPFISKKELDSIQAKHHKKRLLSHFSTLHFHLYRFIEFCFGNDNELLVVHRSKLQMRLRKWYANGLQQIPSVFFRTVHHGQNSFVRNLFMNSNWNYQRMWDQFYTMNRYIAHTQSIHRSRFQTWFEK